ncbi:hypothetical protein SBOR_6567 [Sclerotinia borealis F-4128]|uniref:2,6-dihydroxypyridine 3-monooxygenase substrate binding domain-containing protein n=1 Tax=Sclerotinia borealis (strain F-4128) TaxID=1432307 RepID=W9CB21_SCLBF|nr:hypothetical protein SBOR_6567 [Sclerotinia borealis F-4128]
MVVVSSPTANIYATTATVAKARKTKSTIRTDMPNSSPDAGIAIVSKATGLEIKFLTLRVYPSEEKSSAAKRAGKLCKISGVGIFATETDRIRPLGQTASEVDTGSEWPITDQLTRDPYLEIEYRISSSTIWKILYYVMRANFDGLASDISPQPPKLAGQLGSATYEHGMEVTDVEYKDGLVTVTYRDTGTESHGTVHADLVIAADGAFSKVRQVLQPDLKHKYAGYVAWRGTAPESEISEKTKATFACKTTLFTYKGGYIALYTIPGEDGNTSPGHRQLNWVWYTACLENSQEFVDVMTDVDGHTHRTTLPIGKVDPQNWNQQKALAQQILPAPFAEMVQKTHKPFISAIHDHEIAKPLLFDGKLLFVGDALATFRPHVASSTNQAALDAQLLGQFMEGDIDAAEWEAKVLAFANLTAVRSELWGAYYMSGIPTLVFVSKFFRYWKLVAVQAISKRLYG